MRYTGEVRFRFFGNEERARSLIPLARKFMGELLNDASFNKLEIASRQRTLFSGDIVKVVKSHGMKEIQIFSPSVSGGGESWVMCTGFLVQMIQQTDVDNEDIICVPYVKEPNKDYGDPQEPMKKGSWLFSLGTLFDEDVDFGPNGFLSIPAEGNIGRYDGGVQILFSGFNDPVNQLGLATYYANTVHEPPVNGPRIVGYVEGMEVAAVGHVRANEVNEPLIVYEEYSADSSRFKYQANVDYINELMRQGVESPDEDNGTFTEAMYIRANENYLMAMQADVTVSGKNFTFNPPPYNYDTAHFLKRDSFTYAYNAVALFPDNSIINEIPAYNIFDPRETSYGDWTNWTYEGTYPFNLYAQWFSAILDAGYSLPYPEIGSDASPSAANRLYPGAFLNLFETYVDFRIDNHFDLGMNTSTGYPSVKRKTGDYEVRIVGWQEAGVTGNTMNFTEISGVEYDLEITLFGLMSWGNLPVDVKKTYKVSGVSGERNNVVKITVNKPVLLKKDDANLKDEFVKISSKVT